MKLGKNCQKCIKVAVKHKKKKFSFNEEKIGNGGK